jgi:hypothetical protein
LTPIAILALALCLAGVWRIVRLAIKLLLLAALIALIASQLTSATTHRAAGAPASPAPRAAHQCPLGAAVSHGPAASPVGSAINYDRGRTHAQP